ncbi:MAG TPA: DUF481 domain-containing protein [Longimicrobiales bacterium]|nr:DUF481 domain-containing protein [Longimicrobiales bacterium]
MNTPSLRRSGLSISGCFALLAVAALVSLPRPASAQDEDEARQRWVLKGELTSVVSQGNSEAITLGLGATLRRRYERNTFKFEAGAVRVETGKITRRAVGTAGDFTVTRDVDREKTAESVFARGRFERTVSDAFFLYGGVDWLRNTFAGIDSRTLFALGGGYSWLDTDRSRLSTDFAATYTFEENVVENPFTKSDFAGIRLGWDYWRQLTASTEFESKLVADQNLDESDDRRILFANALSVDVNDIIALKPGVLFNWRNQPALTDVPLFTSAGVDTGTTVETPLEKLDTIFTLALVLTF